MAGTEISVLNPVVTPLYTDVLPETQLAEVGVNSRKISLLQLTEVINGNYSLITTSQTLPSPCPNYICYKFTTPGQVITLPAANGANGHPKGKPIWFFPHVDNTEDFDINTNDGTTFITNIGNNKFMLVYSTNATQNGTPIDRILFADTGSFLPIAGGTLTGDLILFQDATSGLQAVTYQQLNKPLYIPTTTHTTLPTENLANNLCLNVSGCTITINAASLPDGGSTFYQRENGIGVVSFVAGTATVHFCPAGCDKLVENGGATVTRLGVEYFVHGDLTA
jgi:hypothetical protein